MLGESTLCPSQNWCLSIHVSKKKLVFINQNVVRKKIIIPTAWMSILLPAVWFNRNSYDRKPIRQGDLFINGCNISGVAYLQMNGTTFSSLLKSFPPTTTQTKGMCIYKSTWLWIKVIQSEKLNISMKCLFSVIFFLATVDAIKV